jgi:enoyl-CoA hydratase
MEIYRVRQSLQFSSRGGIVMAFENVTLERDGEIAILTVNRPKVLNALNGATVADISAAVDEVAADDEVRVLIVTGAGERAFVAGADISEISQLPSASAAVEMSRRGQEVFFKVERLGKPTIAAINGFALGGGLEIALACDIRIAAEGARLGQPEINLGVIPGYSGTQRLPRVVGRGAAKLIIYTGDMISAQEALRIGLVDKVVAAGELMGTAKALAKQLATKPAVALALAKRSIDLGMEVDLDRGSAIEAMNFGIACSTEDKKEGTAAFLEKRKPVFTGR